MRAFWNSLTPTWKIGLSAFIAIVVLWSLGSAGGGAPTSASPASNGEPTPAPGIIATEAAAPCGRNCDPEYDAERWAPVNMGQELGRVSGPYQLEQVFGALGVDMRNFTRASSIVMVNGIPMSPVVVTFENAQLVDATQRVLCANIITSKPPRSLYMVVVRPESHLSQPVTLTQIVGWHDWVNLTGTPIQTGNVTAGYVADLVVFNYTPDVAQVASLCVYVTNPEVTIFGLTFEHY